MKTWFVEAISLLRIGSLLAPRGLGLRSGCDHVSLQFLSDRLSVFATVSLPCRAVGEAKKTDKIPKQNVFRTRADSLEGQIETAPWFTTLQVLNRFGASAEKSFQGSGDTASWHNHEFLEQHPPGVTGCSWFACHRTTPCFAVTC